MSRVYWIIDSYSSIIFLFINLQMIDKKKIFFKTGTILELLFFLQSILDDDQYTKKKHI